MTIISDQKNTEEHPGTRILALAKNAGIPQRGLSVKLAQLCDVSHRASYKWLVGQTLPRHDNAERIAKLFNTTASFILFGEQPESTVGAQGLPFQLSSIHNMFDKGELDERDLHEIEKFARLLASKNSDIRRSSSI